MKRLENKAAIVTGGTSGMGRAIAELFAAEGASVVISGRDAKRGRDVVKTILSLGGKALFVPGDVASIAVNRRLVQTALNNFHRVDLLVPNAGVLGIGSVKEAPIKIWKRTMDINLNAVYYLIKFAVPHLLKRGGSIVINGSIAAFKAFPNHPAYCASKGALLALTRQLAIDLAPTVRVNMLCPGQVDTPLLWDSAKAFPNPKTVVQEVARRIPMKRLGTPGDVAKAALFLASNDAAWITGTSLAVDGGALTGG